MRSSNTSLWRFVRAARRYYFGNRMHSAQLLWEQHAAFERKGLDYPKALEALNSGLRNAGLPEYDEQSGMCSQHWIAFSGLMARLPPRPRLLEVGTYDARFTRVLAAIYPDAEITTCDLPDDSPVFSSTYDRDTPQAKHAFIEQRNAHLASLSNVRFVQANSFFLPSIVTPSFDAVWVDGGHDYPDVAWDACNAFHLTAEGGFILFDDVYLHPRSNKSRMIPDSNDSFALLSNLEAEGIIEAEYLLKRLTPSSADPLLRKHFALTVKRNTTADAVGS